MSLSLDYQASIPLRDIDTQSNYSLLTSTKSTRVHTNPFADENASIISSLSPPLLPTAFIPTTVLQVQAEGKTPFSLPSPPNQTTIPIFAPYVSDRPKYLSVRPSRRSGTFFLADAEDAEQKPLSKVVFKFGPMRPPMVYLNGQEEENGGFEMNGAIFSHSVKFTSPEYGNFEWRYAGGRERNTVGKNINSLLVLERIQGNGGRRKIAHLIRSDETRTPGTRARDSGNGGRLEIAADEDAGLEILVVTTCLVMLKKEIDRLRGRQIAATKGVGVWC